MRLQHYSVTVIIACALFTIAAVPSVAVPIRIMPLGDSITAGQTDPNWVYPFSFSYRGSLYTQLTDAGYDFQFVGDSPEPWNGIPYGVPPVIVGPDLRTAGQDGHHGYAGSRITNLINGSGYDPGIVAAMNADQPDLVLLMVGINDLYYYGNGGNPTAIMDQLKSLTDLILGTKPNVNMIVAQINPYNDGSLTNSVVDYNNYIKDTLVPDYVSAGYNVSTVDQYSNFVDTNGTINLSLYSNIVHPNAAGYELMADTWFDGIEAIGPITPEPLGVHATGTFSPGTASPVLPAGNLIVEGAGTLADYFSGGSAAMSWGALIDDMNNGVMTPPDASHTTILAWDGVTDDFGWAVYELDTTTNTAGYNISEILSYAAWSDARVNQAVEIKYALVGDTITAGEELGRTLGSFSFSPSTNSNQDAYTTMSITNVQDPLVLSGVSAIEVKYIDNMFDGTSGMVGEPGNYTAYKQFAVIGTPRLLGDANDDGNVDVADLGILAAHYGIGSGLGWDNGDFNADGVVDVADLGVLATNYGTVQSAQSVPEPSAFAGLIGLCLAVILSIGRRTP
ncbi:MAG: hypothetical protein JXM70_08005 [Pirellulales bacterium]|nr:hypothetical protein [Pirellulales bacterium]